MTNSILLQNVSTEQLTELMGKVFKTQLEDFKKNLNTVNPDALLTRAETCELLKIDSSTLWHWTNKGKVICYGIGNRRYYKKNELLNNSLILKK